MFCQGQNALSWQYMHMYAAPRLYTMLNIDGQPVFGKLHPPRGLRVKMFSLSIVSHMLFEHRVWKVNVVVVTVTSTALCSCLLCLQDFFFLSFSVAHSYERLMRTSPLAAFSLSHSGFGLLLSCWWFLAGPITPDRRLPHAFEQSQV